MDTKEKATVEENTAGAENTKTADEAQTAQTKTKSKSKKNDDRSDMKSKKELAEKDKEIEKLKAEITEKDDHHLRLLAEYDNYRKRTQSEKDAIYGTAVIDTVEKILPIVDDMERSLAACADDTSPIAEGVRMIEKKFKDTLEKMGVTAIPDVGEQFNPDLHNAIMHDEDPDKGENEISEVFMKGYKLGDKVVRHSMVKVVN